jgi:hypothetical protein
MARGRQEGSHRALVVWSWMKHQLKDTKVTHMEDLKRSITKLWAIKMADSDYVYLKKLVESMLRRLLEVTEREAGCTKYYFLCISVKINTFFDYLFF